MNLLVDYLEWQFLRITTSTFSTFFYVFSGILILSCCYNWFLLFFSSITSKYPVTSLGTFYVTGDLLVLVEFSFFFRFFSFCFRFSDVTQKIMETLEGHIFIKNQYFFMRSFLFVQELCRLHEIAIKYRAKNPCQFPFKLKMLR